MVFILLLSLSLSLSLLTLIFTIIVPSSPSTTIEEQPIHNTELSEDTAQRESLATTTTNLDFFDEDREDNAESAYMEPAGEEVMEEDMEKDIMGLLPSSPSPLDLEESHIEPNTSVSFSMSQLSDFTIFIYY
jgi:hypothetical protein